MSIDIKVHLKELKQKCEQIKLVSSVINARRIPWIYMTSKQPDKIFMTHIVHDDLLLVNPSSGDVIWELDLLDGTGQLIRDLLHIPDGTHVVKLSEFNSLIGLKDVIGFRTNIDGFDWAHVSGVTVLKKLSKTQLETFAPVMPEEIERYPDDLRHVCHACKGVTPPIYIKPAVNFTRISDIIFDNLCEVYEGINDNFPILGNVEADIAVMHRSDVCFPLAEGEMSKYFDRRINIPFRTGDTAPDVTAYHKKTKQEGKWDIEVRAQGFTVLITTKYEHEKIRVRTMKPKAFYYKAR